MEKQLKVIFHVFKRIEFFCGNYLRIRILSADMTAQTDRQKLPDALVEILDDLDVSTLRSVRTYLDQRIDDLRPTLPEMIRAETEGETVDITDREPYTLVRKYPISRDGSDTYLQPLSLYWVKREKRLNGEETPHWSFLGDVIEPSGVECGDCGVLLDESITAYPHHGEEPSRDEKV